MVDLIHDASLALSPYGPLFCPAGGDIGEVEGIGEHSLRGIAAMSNQISFEESRTFFVPLVGFDWNLFSEERTWLGGRPAPFRILDADRFQTPVNG